MATGLAQQFDDLALPEDASVQIVSEGVAGAIVRSEVEAQLSAAHKYPRSVKRFMQEAITLATLTQDVAEACIYSLPRGGKMIAGPSVRLAEIAASAYGNMQIGARVVDAEEREVVAQGVAWDMEKNLRVTIEARRRITNKHGKRFDDDMIVVTGNAAASIALRNAIFRVIPRAYIEQIYQRARQVAVGDAKSLANRRAEVLDRLAKLGVPAERVFTKLDVKGVDDIGLEQLEVLIGLGTAIKNGDMQLDDAFPAVAPAPAPAAQDGRRISMRGGSKKSEPQERPHDPETGEVAPSTEPEREPGSDG
jgi:hypothetical protein